MAEQRKFNRDKFNTDPAHEADREEFDTMVSDSIERVIKKRAATNPKDESMWDKIGRAFFGGN